MADWIDEVDRIDRSLHRLGVPADIRMKAAAQIMDVLAKAEVARRDRRQVVLDAVLACKGNMRKAAKVAGWSKTTCYDALNNSEIA